MIISENVCIIEYSNYSTHEPRNRVPKSPSGKKRTDQFQIYSPAALISNLASAPARKKPLSPLPSCLLKLRERRFLLLDGDFRYASPRAYQRNAKGTTIIQHSNLSFYINRENNSSITFSREKNIPSRRE